MRDTRAKLDVKVLAAVEREDLRRHLAESNGPLTSACSLGRRGSSRLGKWLPVRSLGIASASVPTRISNGRLR